MPSADASSPLVSPLVSVVIPTLDRPDYLRAALRSALQQSYRNLDIVVQDNASAADPVAVVQGFADPRIRYFRNPVRVNQTENVVSACRRARGDYIAVLCDDDVWHPDFVRAMAAPLEANDDAVLAFCDHDVIDAAGRRDDAATERVTKFFHRDRLRQGVHRPFDEIAIVRRSIPTLSAALLRRSAIAWDSIPLDMPYGLDLYLAYVAARTNKACHYEPRRLAQLRYHAGSLTSSHAVRSEQRLANARAARAYWAIFSNDTAIRRNRRYFELKAAQNTAVIVLALWRRGNRRDAMAEARRSWAAGLMRPSALVSHLVYAVRLGRMRA